MGFKFTKEIIRLEIEDHRFEVPYNQELLVRCDEIGNAAQKVLKSKKNLTDKSFIAETQKLFRDSLDELIGAGAYDQIFEGRGYDLIENADVLFYIIDTIDAFQKKKYPARNTSPMPKPKKKR